MIEGNGGAPRVWRIRLVAVRVTPRHLVLGLLLGAAALAFLAVWAWRAERDRREAVLLRVIDGVANRSFPGSGSRVGDGFACLADVERRAPPEVVQAMRGGSAAPEDASMVSWVEALRACGDAERFVSTEGARTFSDPHSALDGLHPTLFVARVTGAHLAETEPALAHQQCLDALRLATARAQLNLLEAMIFSAALERLAPPCTALAQRLPAEDRRRYGAELDALVRLAPSNAEVLRTERALIMRSTFAWALHDEVRVRLPASDLDELGGEFGVWALVAPQAWRRLDQGWDALLESADDPARRGAGLRGLREASMSPLLPPRLALLGPDYDTLLERLDDARVTLRLMADVVNDRSLTLPPGARREADHVEWPSHTSDGHLLRVPLVPR